MYFEAALIVSFVTRIVTIRTILSAPSVRQKPIVKEENCLLRVRLRHEL